MNYRMIFYTVGRVLRIECIMLLLPAVVSLIYGEYFGALSLLIAAVIALAVGYVLLLTLKPKSTMVFAKEGLITVSLAWIFMSLIGALPFVISQEIPSYIDALFETVSGFTTTGASILTDVTQMSKGMLFWRSFTHWIGGMGILVFVIALSQKSPDRSMNILRAEMPGPIVDKLVPKARDTAKILYLIYIGMTVLMMIFLLCGGMTLYESAVHALATAGTGGFGIKADSVGSYSPYIQWVIAIFMLLFGVNFNLYYLILIRKARLALSSSELRTYLIVVLISVAVICGNIYSMCKTFEETLRLSVFQVAAVVTTTGFSTANFDAWPQLSRTILVLLMFMGGCAGSTAGGLKVSRVMILFKKIGSELKKAVHPRSVNIVKSEGKRVEDSTLDSVGTYFAVYIISILFIFLLLSIESGFNFETNFTAAVSCFNNIGPGLGAVGPMGSYAGYSVFSKLVLTFGMLLGRLEIYPLLIMLIPRTWIRK